MSILKATEDMLERVFVFILNTKEKWLMDIGDCHLRSGRRTCLAPARGPVTLSEGQLSRSDFGRRPADGISVNSVPEEREQEEMQERGSGGLMLAIDNWGSVCSGPLKVTKLLPWNCPLRRKGRASFLSRVSL